MLSLSPPHSDQYRQADRLLVLLPWTTADLLMQRPLLAALRRAAPAAEIVALGADPSVGLVDDGRMIDTRASYQQFGIMHEDQDPEREVLDSLRTWLDRAGRADFAFSTVNAPAAAIQALAQLGIVPIGPELERAGDAFADGASAQAAWLEGGAYGWGLPIDPNVVMRLDPPEWARRSAEEFFEEHRISDWLPATMAPAPTPGGQPWPADRFAEIADRLIASTRAPLLMLPGDEHSAEEVTSHMERAGDVIRVQPRHIFQTAALLQRSRICVCSDPGLLHLAATVGTPAIGIHSHQSDAYRPRFPWAAAIRTDAEANEVWDALRRLIPLTVSPTGVHPTHTAVAGAGPARASQTPPPDDR